MTPCCIIKGCLPKPNSHCAQIYIGINTNYPRLNHECLLYALNLHGPILYLLVEIHCPEKTISFPHSPARRLFFPLVRETIMLSIFHAQCNFYLLKSEVIYAPCIFQRWPPTHQNNQLNRTSFNINFFEFYSTTILSFPSTPRTFNHH